MKCLFFISSILASTIVLAAQVDVCNRSPGVVKLIERNVGKSCETITADDLAKIDYLTSTGLPPGAESFVIKALKVGDLDGLTSLEALRLENVQLESIGSGIFRDSKKMNSIQLKDDSLKGLPDDLFAGLNMTSVGFGCKNLNALPASLADQVQLQYLFTDYYGALKVPDDFFTKLTSLTQLSIGLANSSLPTSIAALENLEYLWVGGKAVSALAPHFFDKMAKLSDLNIHNTSIGSLDDDAFLRLYSLEIVGLSNNQLKSLPAHLFSSQKNLDTLWIDGNPLTALDNWFFQDTASIKTSQQGYLHIGHNLFDQPTLDKLEKTFGDHLAREK